MTLSTEVEDADLTRAAGVPSARLSETSIGSSTEAEAGRAGVP
jgi:hypothetical protein